MQTETLLRNAAKEAEGMADRRNVKDPRHGLWTDKAGLLRAQAAFLAGMAAISLYNFDHVWPLFILRF